MKQPSNIDSVNMYNEKSKKESFESILARISAIFQTISCCVALFTGIYLHPKSVIGIGSSAFFFASGGLSIFTTGHGGLCLNILTLIMNFFSVLSAVVLVNTSDVLMTTDYVNGTDYGFLTMQKIVGILEVSFASTSFILSFKANCCKSNPGTCNSSIVVYNHNDEQLVSLAMPMDQPSAGLQNTGESDLPRYEDVVGKKKDTAVDQNIGDGDLARYEDVLYRPNDEMMVSLVMPIEQPTAGVQNTGDGDLPRYEDVVGKKKDTAVDQNIGDRDLPRYEEVVYRPNAKQMVSLVMPMAQQSVGVQNIGYFLLTKI
eukprot:GFUD01134592.1.p1 GENE.GFUD01134592.1~~GFUD01134592.1.p1  ORF type:complete len:315 (-),score=66.57 GFUD01134592.1:80-1024(-)